MTLSHTTRSLLLRAMMSIVCLGCLGTVAHAQWIQTTGPRGGSIRSFATIPDGSGGTSLFAGQIGVWRTGDAGGSWTHSANGLTDPNGLALLAVPRTTGGHDLFVGTANGVFRSADLGASWSGSSSGIPANLSIYALASGPNGTGGTNLYAGAYLGDHYRSSDNGATWTAANSGLPVGQAHFHGLTTTAAGTVLAGTGNGIYRSTNFGASWTRVFNLYGFGFARNGSTLYAGTSSGVYKSVNDGATWTPINNGQAFAWTYGVAAVPTGSGVTLFATAGGCMRSTDEGATWTLARDGMTSFLVYALTAVPDGQGGTDLYAGSTEGIFRSSDLGDSWQNASFIYSGVRALDVTPTGAILAGTENDAFRSADLGATWSDRDAQMAPLDFAVNVHGTQGVSLFACGAPTGIRKSVDDGVTWTSSQNGLGDEDVNSIAAVPNGAGGSNLLAGTYSELYISTDDGANWGPANLLTLNLDYVSTPNGTGGFDIYTAGFGGVWRSTNYGTQWTGASGGPAGVEGQIVQALEATQGGGTLFAGGTGFGVARSTNQGASWTHVNTGLGDLRVTSLLSPDGVNLFAGSAGGVFLSTDQGEHWTSVGDGLTTGVGSLALSADGMTLLAGTTGFGVWKRPLSELLPVVAVLPLRERGIVLGPSQPNPFRSASGVTIRFALPKSMPARLVVHDVAGRAVRTLVDGFVEAGDRQARWDGRDERGALVASGIYVCRLEAGGESQVRKLSFLH